MKILVTGGSGFIGGNFVLDWIAGCNQPVINLETQASLQGNPRHSFKDQAGLSLAQAEVFA